MDTFQKRVVLGTFAGYTRKIGKYHSALTLAVDIQVSPGEPGPKLSISGDVGYTGARDVESCGQILGDVRRLLDAPGRLNKSADDIRRLLEIWERWHLNDCRPWCEHQRTWDLDKKIVLVTYKLTSVRLVQKNDIRRAAEKRLEAGEKRLEAGETVKYTPEELRIIIQPYEVVVGAEVPHEVPEGYAEASRVTKIANWVRPDEHPDGILTKPCEVCGYKYGSRWMYEALPEDVVAFLRDF